MGDATWAVGAAKGYTTETLVPQRGEECGAHKLDERAWLWDDVCSRSMRGTEPLSEGLPQSEGESAVQSEQQNARAGDTVDNLGKSPGGHDVGGSEADEGRSLNARGGGDTAEREHELIQALRGVTAQGSDFIHRMQLATATRPAYLVLGVPSSLYVLTDAALDDVTPLVEQHECDPAEYCEQCHRAWRLAHRVVDGRPVHLDDFYESAQDAIHAAVDVCAADAVLSDHDAVWAEAERARYAELDAEATAERREWLDAVREDERGARELYEHEHGQAALWLCVALGDAAALRRAGALPCVGRLRCAVVWGCSARPRILRRSHHEMASWPPQRDAQR